MYILDRDRQQGDMQMWKERRTRPRLARRCKQQHCAGKRECNGPPGLSNRFRSSSLFVYGVSCVLQLHHDGNVKSLERYGRQRLPFGQFRRGVPFNWIKRRVALIFYNVYSGIVLHCNTLVSLARRCVNLFSPVVLRNYFTLVQSIAYISVNSP